MKTLSTITIGLITFAISGEALAAETDTAPFEPGLETRVQEFPWESAYFPSGGPLRIKLGAVAWQDIAIDMLGDAEYEWDSNSMVLRGQEDGGEFLNTVGAEITATVAIDVFGLETEAEIGIYDISEMFSQDFTPYVLDGNADSPVSTMFSIGPFNIADQDFTIGSAEGTFVLDFRIDSPGVDFQGTRVDLSTEAGSVAPDASITSEGEVVQMLMGGDPGQTVEVYGVQHGLIDSELSVHLLPSVQMTAFGIDFEIGPFDIEMAYPLLEGEPIVFDEMVMEYDVPEAPEEPEGDDDDDDDDDGNGGDGGEPEGDDDDDDEPEEDDEEEEDEEEEDEEEEDMLPADPGLDMGGVDDGGCGCTSGRSTPNGLAFGLVVLGLIALRRRRFDH